MRLSKRIGSSLICLILISLGVESKARAATWTAETPMPTARYAAGVGEINGTIYVVGGLGAPGNTALATVEAYDTTTDSWSTKAPMPTARAEVAIGVVNGILYAIGGEVDGASMQAVEAYDPITNAWTTKKAAMPTSRYGVGVSVVNGIVYAIGGLKNAPFTAPQILQTVEAYDPSTDSWSTKASMPTARWNLGAAAVNGMIYAAGGNLSSSSVGTTFEAYDPAADQWSIEPSMPTPRNLLGVSSLNGVIYCIGGGDSGGSGLNAVEAFDPCTETWIAQVSMPTARFGLGACVVNGRCFAIGGATASGGVKFATVETFTTCPNSCPADIAPNGGNGFVNVDDLLKVINAWGKCK